MHFTTCITMIKRVPEKTIFIELSSFLNSLRNNTQGFSANRNKQNYDSSRMCKGTLLRSSNSNRRALAPPATTHSFSDRSFDWGSTQAWSWCDLRLLSQLYGDSTDLKRFHSFSYSYRTRLTDQQALPEGGKGGTVPVILGDQKCKFFT